MEALKKKIEATINSFHLNDAVVVKELQRSDKGNYYSIYAPKLTDGGATLIVGDREESVSLEKPAVVEYKEIKVYPQQVVYRIAFELEEALKAAEDDTKYNTYILPILIEAVNRYIQTFGAIENVRYGSNFCNVNVVESGEYLEVQFSGKWASSKELDSNDGRAS